MIDFMKLKEQVDFIERNPENRYSVFEYLTNYFLTWDVVQGVYEGPEVKKIDDENAPGYKEYRRYKAEVNKLKKTITLGWSNQGIKYSPAISPLADKLAILTGYTETQNKLNVIVLDVDDINKFSKFCEMNNISMQINTFTVKTGEGYHLYFICTHNIKFRCRSYKKYGFDIRATGGYVIAPGSIHPGTHTIYSIINAASISDAPEWLLGLSNDDNKLEYELILGIKTSLDNKNTQTTEIPTDENKIDIDVVKHNIVSLPEKNKNLIIKTNSDDRSRDSITVMNYLVGHGWPKEEIEFIYDTYPIGEKSREKEKYNYFESDYRKAVEYVSKNKKNQENNNLYSVISMLDIYNSDIKLCYIIKPFLLKSSQLLLCGKSGSCKSHITLQMAVELLNPLQNKFLNEFEIVDEYRPKKILLLNGENHPADLKDKIVRICSSLSDKIRKQVLSGIICMTKSTLPVFTDNLDDNKFINAIDNIIKENEIDMIIIDNLQCYHYNDENNNAEMRRSLNQLSPMLVKYNIPCIIVHHSGKSDSTDNYSRGAGSIIDWASHSLLISKKNNTLYNLYGKKLRNNGQDGEIELTFDGNVLLAKNNNDNKNDIVVKALQSMNNICYRKGDLVEIIMKNTGLSTQKATSLIDDAVANGVICKSKGKKNSYILTIPGINV